MWDDISVQPCLTCGTFANSIVEIDLWMSGGGSKSLLHKVNKLDEQCHHFRMFLKNYCHSNMADSQEGLQSRRGKRKNSAQNSGCQVVFFHSLPHL